MFVMIAAAGCHRLKDEDRFYQLRLPEEKLRQIEPLDLAAARRQNPPAPAEPNQPPATVTISLEECRALALENNLDIQASLIAPSIAQAELLAEEAKFEAAFTARATLLRSDEPGGKIVPIPDSSTYITSIDSSQHQNINLDLGVRVPLQTGGTLSFNLADARTKNLEENSLLSPWYQEGFRISISQPLLQNAGKRTNLHSIRLARYGKQLQDNATKLEVIRVLAAADRAYWRLYAARQELEVRRRQHDLAVAQLERARRFVAAGQLAPIEVLRAQAGVARQLAAIITAENSLRERQREFKRTINKPGMQIDTSTIVVPLTEPDPVHYVFDPNVLIAQAFENRADLLSLELQLAQDASRIDFARNQALPLVNLDYSYAINGVGPMRSDAWDMLTDKNFENHYLGVSLYVPLGNDQNRNRLRAALFTRRQRLATRESQQQMVAQEVLNAIDQVETNWQQILASRQSAILEAELYQAEIRQFEVGLRTSTDVLEAQTNFANAQSAEIAALANYQISLVDLAFATGTLLGAAKVEWTPAVPDIGIAP
jgi:outer membrane protein TolC